jgi:hypothetical protein
VTPPTNHSPGAHASAGHRLADRQRPPAPSQQSGDRVLGALVVETHHVRRQQPDQLVDHGIDQRQRGRTIGPHPGHPDPGLGAGGQERQLRIAVDLQPPVEFGDALGDRRLGDAGRADQPADGDLQPTTALQQGDHVRVGHRVHLARHARQAHHQRVVDREREAGRGAGRRDHAGTHRKISLHQVALGHVPATGLEVAADAVGEVVVAGELDAGELGDGVAGAVILRGPEAAGGDDDVVLVGRATQRGADLGESVAHDRVPPHVDAELDEPGRQPCRIGVDGVAEEQLGADGHDLGARGAVSAGHAPSALP